MASPNRYFNNYSFTPTQKLSEDLVVEAIRQTGLIVYYLPKEVVDMDNLFGEDGMLKFEDAVQIEMYLKNSIGFEGNGRILSQIGVEIPEEMTFTVSSRRFAESRAEHLLTETNQLFEQEETYRYAPGQFNGIILEDASREGYFVKSYRPMEGDLIYLPMINKLMDIKVVTNEPVFWQFGNYYTYDLICQTYQYSSERLNTGYPTIDSIEDLMSTDVSLEGLLTEANETMSLEEGGILSLEFDIWPKDNLANNSVIQSEAYQYVDFSERSPFTKLDKW